MSEPTDGLGSLRSSCCPRQRGQRGKGGKGKGAKGLLVLGAAWITPNGSRHGDGRGHPSGLRLHKQGGRGRQRGNEQQDCGTKTQNSQAG